MMKRFVSAIAICFVLRPSAAQVFNIGPFIGDRSETLSFDHPGSALPTLDIFGGAVTIDGPPALGEWHHGSIKVEAFSSLGGDPVAPRTPPWIIAILYADGDPRAATFTFHDTNVTRFGGYFNNNSHTDDAVFEFFDRSGVSMGAVTADIPEAGSVWVWHGFSTLRPIGYFTLKGLSPPPFSGGFIWWDDLQIGFASAAGAGACCLDDGSCVQLTDADCGTLRGATYNGEGVLCADTNGNGISDACEAPACDADSDGSGDVGIGDFLDVLAQWGLCPSVCNADVDHDGSVSIGDFLMVLANWGPCP